ncbi:UDP-N-acetylmuramoyl-tripeptide--D-alanyl-D-alanine ligase [Calorimonas adulescens]|nr:UDP-N-acetylmuramoyl-tripeptide--D-alanyl-D-alanine ligase [Calorimonas adulescens]
MITLDDILFATKGNVIGNAYHNLSFSGISIDSRNIKNGQLFIPLVGERFDGHDFILNAVRGGATACLTQKDIEIGDNDTVLIRVQDTLRSLQDIAKYMRQKYSKVKVIAITGSTGKTTTKNFVTSVLSQKYKVLSNIGNYNNQIGLPLTLVDIDETHDIAVLEMGMNSFGEIRNLSDIARPDVAIITNIGTAHIGNLGSRENILKAKLEITEFFGEDNIAYFNGDDDLLNKVNGNYRILYFGFNEKNDIQAFNIKSNKQDGMEFDVRYKGDIKHFMTKIPGKHNILNALPAIAAGYNFGMKYEDIFDGLAGTVNEKMRLKLISVNGISIIDDTYNANPDSVKAAIDYLIDISTNRRKVVILGDMLELGEYTVKAHEEIGEYCHLSGIDLLIAYGDYSKHIVDSAVNSGMRPGDVFYYQNKQELFRSLKTIVKPGDVILVKGSRGMKMDEIVDYLEEKYDGTIF